MSIQILMPALSPTMTEGTLSKWLKKEGDKIEPGQVIAEIETDKATMEVEAVDEGVMGKIVIPEGTENVSVGSLIAVILEEGEDALSIQDYKQTELSKKEDAENLSQNINNLMIYSHKTKNEHSQSESGSSKIFASPLAKRIAQQNSVSLNSINGSGPHGRIIKSDILDYVSNNPISKTNSNLISFDDNLPEFSIQSLTNMRKVIAKRLLESKQTIPHFYLSLDCNLDNLLKAREEINSSDDVIAKSGKISVNDFIIKASALALRDNPDANSSWTDSGIKIFNKIDISVAVAVDEGLVTPIVKFADKKSLTQISSEIKDLAKRARESKLKPEEYQGGSFTISNLGMFGIKKFQAIINPPQSCILAIGASEKRPVVLGDQIKISNIIDISLSCDHRVVDGAVGAKLLSSIKKYLENPMLMFV